eukprot:CAMPEP_0170511388 /NCGR_PEP_ID=MMETSP0208-20121228/66281_1 /TAXON_ID=197538 /ORGANISM="Strombidium inclinatum, Strain S3" /LENGTH=126 /DNA_ID=CAMNT_0010794929 /DNA_START=37 /DNA_END=417 /DNA_ORIENTATION=+
MNLLKPVPQQADHCSELLKTTKDSSSEASHALDSSDAGSNRLIYDQVFDSDHQWSGLQKRQKTEFAAVSMPSNAPNRSQTVRDLQLQRLEKPSPKAEQPKKKKSNRQYKLVSNESRDFLIDLIHNK